jgi:tRNA threonylcarbamoyl adenosine modification protein (Sua5/YciO/YrdC/YwlC family)
MRLEVNRAHPEPRKIERAAALLRDDGVIAYPTDTVYGLGCDLRSKKGVERVYRIKKMKPDQPLAFICPDLGDLAKYAVVDDRTYRLMRRLTPGPYCFILEATREVPRILHMKRKTVGIRVPHDEVALALVRALGSPLVTTTATIDGEALVDPAEIDARFHGLDMVLDGGFGGLVPSTVLDLTGQDIVVVREGAGDVDAL